VSEPSQSPVPYRVTYSGRVREEFRKLTAEATEGGFLVDYRAALKEIERRLRIYPQFGEPKIDLTHEQGQIWLGTVPPLVIRYAIYEDRRLVLVTDLPTLLPNYGK
jgi:hypothetical protein